jgi:arsenite-transporting ATPase
LIISTDPAHNISDAFDQKIGCEPTQIIDVPNLYAMEIRPRVNTDNLQFPDFMGTPDESSKNLLSEIINSVPGIDEAMSFGELMKNVQEMAFSIIIFDTAPTGHTLRLL